MTEYQTLTSEVEKKMKTILNFSLEDIMNVIRKVLQFFKQIMAWLGILVLPEEGDYEYPTSSKTTAPQDEG